jgi:hypothetical protein
MTDRVERLGSTELRRFREEEQLGIASLAGWIGHAAVRPAILRFALYAEAAVTPLDAHLEGQPDVICLCWGAFGMSPVEPGWIRRGRTWVLTTADRAAAEAARTSIAAIARSAARAIAAAGARVDPGWNGDLAVIAELTVLETVAGFSVPWHLPPRELAEALQPPGVSAIQIDARRTEHRRWISDRAGRNAAALRRSYEEHLLGPKTPAPYAEGGTRASRQATLRRQEAMRGVLAAFPDTKAADILTSYHGSAFRTDGRPASPADTCGTCWAGGSLAPRRARSTAI